MAISQEQIYAGVIALISVSAFLVLQNGTGLRNGTGLKHLTRLYTDLSRSAHRPVPIRSQTCPDPLTDLSRSALWHYVVLCIPYFIVIYPFLRSNILPDGDTWKNFSREFFYLAEAVSKRHFLPEWLPSCSGIRTGFFHIISFFTLPHRIFGYYFYTFIPTDILFVYKLQYIAGVVVASFGWWLVLRKLTRSQYGAYFGTLMIMMGGTGIALHQEQVVATIYLIPWFLLSLLKMQDDSSYIFPAVALFGLSMNTHLPQIHIISLGLFFFIIILPRFNLIKKIYRERIRHILFLFLIFLIAILPTIYLVANLDNLSSAHRDSEIIFPKNYEEYLATNTKGYSSALRVYFKQYITPLYTGPVDDLHGLPTDRQGLFVGRIAFLLIITAFILSFRKAAPIFLLLIGFVLLTLGTNSFIPVLKFFYVMRFPFIKLFREWYHFFPFVNFCLSGLAALGVASLEHLSRKNKISRITFFALVIPLLFLHVADLALYDKGCISSFNRMPLAWNNPGNFLTVEAREGCGSAFFIQYKNRFRLARDYPQAIPVKPFITTKVVPVKGGVDKEFKTVGEIAAEGGGLTVVNGHPYIFDTFLSKDTALHKEVSGNLNFEGLSFDTDVPENSLLVTPLNYDLGVEGYVDGKKTDVWRVNSALCGILAEKGNHRMDLKVALDSYTPIAWTQMLLYILLAGFFIFKYYRLEE